MSDNLVFTFDNLDVNAIYQIYPDKLSDELREHLAYLSEEDRVNLKQTVTLGSSIVITHPHFGVFNELYADYDKAIQTNDESAKTVANAEYDTLNAQLCSRIIGDIKEDFTQAILINEQVKQKLEPHLDTLLFICLSYYNRLWDTFGEGFNGNVVNYPVNDLTHQEQPFRYRSSTQIEFISNLLYSHYTKPNAPKGVSFVTGGRTHSTDDPLLVDWLVKLITADTLPLSLERNGIALAKLLNYREKMPHTEFLTQLQKFTILGTPNYSNTKRKVVAEYCLAIHLIFSYYMDLPINSLIGKRSTIYHNILLAFKMDDFSVMHRETSNTKSRADDAANRLGVLLRQYPNFPATKDSAVL